MKGFTLLEVMVSLAIIAGVLVTVLTTFVRHLEIAGRDREETVAVLLARAKLDESLLRGDKAGTGSFAPARPGFRWSLAVEPSQWVGLETCTMSLSWGEPEKRMVLVQYRETK